MDFQKILDLNKYQPISIYVVEGEAFDRGKQYGEQAQDQIKENIIRYEKWFRGVGNISWEELKPLAEEYIPEIEKYDAETIKEMEGMAVGAGVHFIDIVILNAHTELGFNAGGGCTSAAAEIEGVYGKRVIVFQNWDFMPDFRRMILIIKQPNGPNVVVIGEVGMVAKTGMNTEGIGLCLNLLTSDGNRVGVPFHVVSRKVLKAKTLGEAIEVIAQAKRACSGNYMLGDSKGGMVNVETTATDFATIFPRPEENYIYHSNHFVALKGIKDITKSTLPDSMVRYQRIRELFKKHTHLTLEKCQNVMRDHYNVPNSLCRHIDPRQPEHIQMLTTISIFYDVSRKQIHYTPGPPCMYPYQTINLWDL